MPATYEPIATTTLGSAASSITFSSIPATYTDLIIVWVFQAVSAGSNAGIRFNSDTGNNYSYRGLTGTGGTVVSQGSSNNNQCYIQPNSTAATSQLQMFQTDVFSYAGSTNKTLLTSYSGDLNGSGDVSRVVNLWRNTSAITSVTLFFDAGNMTAGTTATLYGIKNA
jgi:Zn-dependent M28 family amino/carboxypeptidase